MLFGKIIIVYSEDNTKDKNTLPSPLFHPENGGNKFLRSPAVYQTTRHHVSQATNLENNVFLGIKQYHYKPGQALRVPGV
jgi:hypothetical protein